MSSVERTPKAIDTRTAPYGALLLRVGLGLLFVAHLYWKSFVRPGGWSAWWANLNVQGYPDWVICYVLSAEVLGALCLVPGILTRWIALYSLPVLVGAAHYWIGRKGFFFTAAGAELPILWAVGLVVLAALGDGPHALIPSPPFPFIGRRRATSRGDESA